MDALKAFTTAFSLLQASRALGDEASSMCSTAILLLTDGEITEGLGVGDPSDVTSFVEALNADIGAEIFTFALGPDADGVSESNLIGLCLREGIEIIEGLRTTSEEQSSFSSSAQRVPAVRALHASVSLVMFLFPISTPP